MYTVARMSSCKQTAARAAAAATAGEIRISCKTLDASYNKLNKFCSSSADITVELENSAAFTAACSASFPSPSPAATVYMSLSVL